ncbi:DNA-directed RNA polymerase subunit omega [candidate division KSB1 bacterium]
MADTMDLREIDGINDNVYEAVMASAKRARQLHERITDELKKKLGEIENEEDLDEEILDREKIVKEFDSKPKPSVIALGEYLEGKLHFTSGEAEKK